MLAEIAERSRASDSLVLGGDIFDFRWSVQGSHQATLDATRKWLHELLDATGDRPIVYLPGNHDCHPDFLQVLEELSRSEPRFSWAEHHLQIGDCLFLHGDVLDAGGLTGLDSYRRKFHHEMPQSNLAHRTYDLAVGMRIHKLVPMLLHSPTRTCQRLLHTVRQISPDVKVPVRKVYFGHTHVPIHGLQVDRTHFFNPGAALRHMQLHVQEFRLGPE